MEPRIADTDVEILRCFPVLSQLRPHVKREEFLPRIRLLQSEGYRLAFVEDSVGAYGERGVVAVAGYRVSTNLALGRYLYVDDLVTASTARSNGYGRTLLNWLRKRAKEEGCEVLHLDSGTQRHRAHRFYFRQGLRIASYHFREDLT